MSSGKRSYFEGEFEIHEIAAKSTLAASAKDIREFARDAYDIQPVRGRSGNGFPTQTLGRLGITIVRARTEGYEWSHGKTKEEAIESAREAAGLPASSPTSLKFDDDDDDAPETAKVPATVGEDLSVRLNIGNMPLKVEANNERALRVALLTLVEALRPDEEGLTMDSNLASMIKD